MKAALYARFSTEKQSECSIEEYGAWSAHDKPRGLWVSVDGEQDWKEWCEAESFGIGQIHYRVSLCRQDRILFLKTADEILAFTKRYGGDSGRLSFPDIAIDWHHVASEYAGIIIAPYCSDLRFHDLTNWYYGWDCASGCIWDASAIAKVEEVREVQAT